MEVYGLAHVRGDEVGGWRRRALGCKLDGDPGLVESDVSGQVSESAGYRVYETAVEGMRNVELLRSDRRRECGIARGDF